MIPRRTFLVLAGALFVTALVPIKASAAKPKRAKAKTRWVANGTIRPSVFVKMKQVNGTAILRTPRP